jgi:hypothetical protein
MERTVTVEELRKWLAAASAALAPKLRLASVPALTGARTPTPTSDSSPSVGTRRSHGSDAHKSCRSVSSCEASSTTRVDGRTPTSWNTADARLSRSGAV